MKKVLYLLPLLLLCACNNNKVEEQPAEAQDLEIVRVQERAAYVEYDATSYDSAASAELHNTKFHVNGGACSSWRTGNFQGRNLDWRMDDYTTIVVKLPKGEHVKYASIGTIGGADVFNKEFLDNNTTVPDNVRATLPSYIVDGINEMGLCINHNIVVLEPAIADNICMNGVPSTIVCRCILDNCANVEEAKAWFESHPVAQALAPLGDLSHFMISDKERTMIVEFPDGTNPVFTIYTKGEDGQHYSEEGVPAIMTNFYACYANVYEKDAKKFYTMHPYAVGIERYETIKKQLATATTVDANLEICKSVWYYAQFTVNAANPKWLTDNAGVYTYDGTNWFAHVTKEDGTKADVKAANYTEAMKKTYADMEATGYFKSADKEEDKALFVGNPLWYTEHSVVFDIENLSATYIAQEGWFGDKFTYSLK